VQRSLYTSLFILSVQLVSCGAFSSAPTDLPAVSAAPPAVSAAPPAVPVPAPAPVAPEPAPLQGLEKQIADRIARYDSGLAPHEQEELARTLVAEASRHALDPMLVVAVVHVESRFNTFAVSPVGAMGLMQVMPRTGEEIARQLEIPWQGSQTLFDPILNVRIGVAYLKHLAMRYESIPTALAAYNWGPGHIDRRIRKGSQLPQKYPGLVSKVYDAARLARSS